MPTNRDRGKGYLELFEGHLCCFIPMEFASFLEEGSNRRGNLAEVPNELMIEVGKSQEHSDVMHGLRLGPFGDSGHFGRVHLHSFGTHNESQELHLLYMKLTFA